MPEYKPPITRRDTAKGHHYRDANGARVPGVTTVAKNGMPKGDALIGWAAKATAGYAVDRWDELGQLPPAARYERLLKARYEDRDTATNKGTAVHRFGEQLLAGREPLVPADLVGHVEAYAKFLTEFDVEAVYVEFGCVSYRFGWAGTADLCAWITLEDGRRVLALIDVKTSRSGIFGEVAVQLAGYRFADYWQVDGRDIPVPTELHGCYALHVRSDGYSLHPIEVTEREHEVLWHAKVIGDWAKDSRDLVGEAMTPPTTARVRLVRVDELGRLET